MINISNLAKSFGGKTLFGDVTVDLAAPHRYGLVGANGCGKSTFAKIVSGAEALTSGTISIPKRMQIGVLQQDRFESDEQRILDVVLMGQPELYTALRERERMLATVPPAVVDPDRIAAWDDVINRYDGYTAEARAGEILEGLGISSSLHGMPLGTLSGGFKLRVLLAQTLAANPDILILDEPTNHLDILSIRWLETFLLRFMGCAVIISHDRNFLDAVCTHILDVDYETITLYTGNYSSFEEQKVQARERKEAEIEKRERKIADHQEFIDRFKAKATKARQAQSRVKQMERITVEKLPETSRRSPRFQFLARRQSGREVLELSDITKTYGEKRVLHRVSLSIRRGERVAVIGANGVGKSTLLKILVSRETPDEGAMRWGHETYPGYFAQDHRDLIDAAGTVESWLWASVPEEPKGAVRSRLGAVLFSGDDAEKALRSLSGGEAARLIFARLTAESPNVLLLDEPTNHLDIESIEALTEALRVYDGTLVFVSHDRWFVSRLADRIIEIRSDGIFDYQGTYDEYVSHTGADHLDSEAVTQKAKQDSRREAGLSQGAAERLQRKTLERERRRLEKERDQLTTKIEEGEQQKAAIHRRYCEPEFFAASNAEEVSRLQAEETLLDQKIEAWMTAWEEVEEKLATLST